MYVACAGGIFPFCRRVFLFLALLSSLCESVLRELIIVTVLNGPHTQRTEWHRAHTRRLSVGRALSVDDTHNANGRATEIKLKRCLASECVVCLCYCLLNCLCSAVVGLDAHSHSRARTHTHTMRRIPAMERAPVAFQRAEWNVTGGTKSKG